MDPITTAIIAALSAGAINSLTDITKAAITDGYNKLRDLITKKHGASSDVVLAIDKLEAKPESQDCRDMLDKTITTAKANQDEEIFTAVKQILTLVQPQLEDSGKYRADYREQVPRLVTGDHANDYFPAKPRIISEELYEELKAIAGKINAGEINLSKKDLMDASCASVPSSLLPPEVVNKFVDEILDFIIEKSTQLGKQSTTGKWPIVEFIRYLSAYTSGHPIQKELDLWLEKFSKETNTPLPEETVNITSVQDASFHLLVKFELNCDNEDEVYIEAWFLKEQNGEIKPLPYKDKEKREWKAYHLADAHTRLGDLILYGEEYVTRYFTIELFLPFVLLNHCTYDVHQWKFYDEINNLCFVAREHPLVLRSYERVYQYRSKRIGYKWEDNEKICKKYAEGGTTMSWVAASKFVREEEAYENVVHVDYEEAPCLVMTFVPPKCDANSHIFKTMISVGTSVALWLRSGHEFPDQDAIKQAYQALLGECEFSELPRMIWKRRRDASRDKSSIVNYLTLFWDRYHLLPPDAPNTLEKSRSNERK